MQDQNPGLEGAGEQAEELELVPEEFSPGEPSGDPLDDIKDEVARAEAKKWRAIARRSKDQAEHKEETPTAPTPSEVYLTKADFYKTNERKAIKEATADPEVKANWQEIAQYYSPRRGKETPEDIAEDIQDAVTLFKARQPAVAKDDGVNELTASPVIKPSSGAAEKEAPKAKPLPSFKLPTQPKDWYQKS